ncbi:AAA family ATPase [Cohnella sp. CFH 77786]|uniref:UvrD-helicase domain-containing protein n=1 Tax=Cohnella sp. CFH 77786 TaxID=2662265 RepID=UPI001C60EDF2|nr:UvrD-helicase domain-containing protein [Cohnella sp. CFH 77786]MBW5444903.1 AAA family ATPase [Cohnella sp. CFH 77786]
MNRQPGRWPQRPEGSRWTEEQWAAIAADGSHLLVAAAAGSGKTAVLVERIIRRIADPDRPLNVDALLVATFTKAAAAEMKERIRHALEEALERNPDSLHLERQLALLPRATVTTLHSFCLEAVERYAPLIGLDPGFRIANETEAELLRMDTLDELFEETYAREGETGTLARLADRFGGERSDEPLHRLVLELREFAGSHPWPEYWLKEMAARFRVRDAEELLLSLWVRSLRDDARLQLRGAVHMLECGLRLCGEPGGPAPYGETLEGDLHAVRGLLAALETDDWPLWRDAFASFSFGRLKPCRGDEYDPALQERVKAYRDAVKKTAAKLAEEWLVRSPERYAEEMRELAPDMEALADLAIRFGERYEAAKRAKGLLDFGDLEHYALRILRDPASTPQRSVPSDAAEDYRKRFAEIYLDEYQDTNEVQEAIVSLIARTDPGNVFMVGDVKQSIYRFRLAEPGLFMAKYKTYDIWHPGLENAESPEGLRIDLARNFRSRRQVLDAVNHVFRLIMREPVGEMTYDRSAELVYGQGYPDTEPGGGTEAAHPDAPNGWGVEMIVLDSAGTGSADDASESPSGAETAGNAPEGPNGETGEDSPEGADPGGEDLESAQLEARCVATEIRRLMGNAGTGEPPFAVYDGRSGLYRPVQYRDIVILLRATSVMAPIYLEELKAAGIPAYADLATGYFSATEVDVMLSLLSIIDNPRQDIPLAGVLRSPIVGLTADELARIRLCDRNGEFWDAVVAAAKNESLPEALRASVSAFVANLSEWRDLARREPLQELLWTLYRETGYYDFVGGMPGGTQRQANLRALVDRSRSYEQSSRFRGLFRFLRFLGRMRETGSDLGAARALGEGENVVRIVSIHKSKGLEFPVVFAAGMGRGFNRRDLNGMFLKHKTLGFGPRMVETDTRVTYPTLPQLAIRRRLAAEMLAEEMRVLYVALTRPKEKLFLIGTVKDAAKQWDKWRETASMADEALPDHSVAAAARYLDWLGPAAVLAGSAWNVRPGEEGGGSPADRAPNPSVSDVLPWSCRIVPASVYTRQAAAARQDEPVDEGVWEAVLRGERADTAETPAGRRIRSVLSWRYPHENAAKVAAKTSITAWKKRLSEEEAAAALAWLDEETPGGADDRAEAESGEPALDAAGSSSPVLTYRLRRPRFLSETKMTPAERGTVFHLVMQHLPLRAGIGSSDIAELLHRMTERFLLTPEQRDSIDPGEIAAFCGTELYGRMCRADRLWREVPFTYGIQAGDVYAGLSGVDAEETVIIQGVVDCLFAEADGLVLLDYKTDALKGRNPEDAAEKHRFQVGKYGEAVAGILGRPVREAYVYFFDGGHEVRLW